MKHQFLRILVLAAFALGAVSAVSAAALPPSGFQPGVNAPEQADRIVSVYGTISRLPAGRGRTVTVRMLLYRAPRSGAAGTLVARSPVVRLGPRDPRVGVVASATRPQSSRSFIWWGIIRYTVRNPRGRVVAERQGVGASVRLNLR